MSLHQQSCLLRIENWRTRSVQKTWDRDQPDQGRYRRKTPPGKTLGLHHSFFDTHSSTLILRPRSKRDWGDFPCGLRPHGTCAQDVVPTTERGDRMTGGRGSDWARKPYRRSCCKVGVGQRMGEEERYALSTADNFHAGRRGSGPGRWRQPPTRGTIATCGSPRLLGAPTQDRSGPLNS